MLQRVMTSSSANEAVQQAGSEVLLDEWVAPEIADERGHLRAGKILEWMDVVGVLAAVRHCRAGVVTASVDGMALREPIAVGERVTLRASVVYTSTRSMGVGIRLGHGTPNAASPNIVDAYMTFVGVDDAGKPVPVPQVVPSTPDAVARFREGKLRHEFRQKLSSGGPWLEPAQAVERVEPSERVAFVQELLKLLPRPRPFWERADLSRPRERHVSYVHKIEPVRGKTLNFHGSLYGGTLMRWLETTATMSARAYLDNQPVRLVALHGLNFLRPIHPHTFVHIHSVVVHSSAQAVTVLVNVQAEAPLEQRFTETVRAFLTYAPLEPTRIPKLTCVGDEESALAAEVEQRLSLHRVLAGQTSAG